MILAEEGVLLTYHFSLQQNMNEEMGRGEKNEFKGQQELVVHGSQFIVHRNLCA
jgi:hypothetical protein